MEGVAKDPDKQGVIPRSFEHIFKHIAQSHDRQYLVRASYLEIYKEQIRFAKKKEKIAKHVSNVNLLIVQGFGV